MDNNFEEIPEEEFKNNLLNIKCDKQINNYENLKKENDELKKENKLLKNFIISLLNK